jgi:hypothetical protein
MIYLNKTIYPNTQSLKKKIQKLRKKKYKRKSTKKYNLKKPQKISTITRVSVYDDYKFIYYCNTKHRNARDKYNARVLKKELEINYLIKQKKPNKKKLKVINEATKLKMEKEKKLKAALTKFYREDLEIGLNRGILPKFKFFFHTFYNSFKYKLENEIYSPIQYYPKVINEINKIRIPFFKKRKNKHANKNFKIINNKKTRKKLNCKIKKRSYFFRIFFTNGLINYIKNKYNKTIIKQKLNKNDKKKKDKKKYANRKSKFIIKK